MDKKTFLIVLLIVNSFTSNAQQYLVSLKEQAAQMVDAIKTGDYKTLVKYTHPKVITVMGGPQKALQIISKGMQDMKASGASFEKASVGNYQQLMVNKANIQCLIPQVLEMKISGQTIEAVTYLLSITYNNGKDWYFVDVGRGNDAKVRKLIPEMSSKIVVPPSTKGVK